ncbi:MAG TPA: NifU N-terminal domain-containing protein [Tepidisphaeraceae bacterium]|nr:NifU N-terminal domain-containing protein [Tepidisphaeraceae bacterium]
MPLSVKEVQATPNPNAMKFVLDGTVAATPASFFNAESAGGHPIASRLFEIPGVRSVLLLGDFITVNKAPDVKWTQVTAKVKRALADVLKEADSNGS